MDGILDELFLTTCDVATHDIETYFRSQLLEKLLLRRNQKVVNNKICRRSFPRYEQSNPKELRTIKCNKLVQLVDVNNVNADVTIDLVAILDRPYDWTMSGNPILTGRTFGFCTTDKGLNEIKGFADDIGLWQVDIARTTLANGQVNPFTMYLVDRTHQQVLLMPS